MFRKVLVFFGITLFLVFSGTLYAQDDVMFNYQGKVKVQGTPFNGSGQFKFAIVNNAGSESLWSNDNTSSGGGEPASSITISVSNGVFNAMIGDTGLGMSPINRSIFNHPNQIKLRIWFSDGTHGYQQLLPDHKLVGIELMGMMTGDTDFTIYVNGVTGNDEYNGLSPGKAKKTIQAAIDVLPERLRCNVTIDIADGVYRERVNIYGITMNPEKRLTLLGDESWTNSSSGDPAVRITGIDDDISGTKVRDWAVYARDCSSVCFKGLFFEGATINGLGCYMGACSIENCKAKNNLNGMVVATNASASLINSLSDSNSQHGIHIGANSVGGFNNCISQNNGGSGISLNTMATGSFSVSGDFSNNSASGILAVHNSKLFFADGYSGTINNNGDYPIRIRYDSYSEDHTKNTFSGNTPSNTVYTDNGGHTYF